MEYGRQILKSLGGFAILIGIVLFFIAIFSLIKYVQIERECEVIDGQVTDIRFPRNHKVIVDFRPIEYKNSCISLLKEEGKYKIGDVVKLYYKGKIVAVRDLIIHDLLAVIIVSFLMLGIGIVIYRFNKQIQDAFDRGDIDVGGM